MPFQDMQVDVIGWRLRFSPTALWSLLLQATFETHIRQQHASAVPTAGGFAAQIPTQASTHEPSMSDSSPSDCSHEAQLQLPPPEVCPLLRFLAIQGCATETHQFKQVAR